MTQQNDTEPEVIDQCENCGGDVVNSHHPNDKILICLRCGGESFAQ